MSSRPKAYESKSYEEWRDESWQGALPALEALIEKMREHGVAHARIGKPFDLEVWLDQETKKR